MKLLFLTLCLSCVMLLAAAPAMAEETLILATTTSTDSTGLLDALAPMLKEDLGVELKWTAVGTGKARKMGENCDADVVLVHAPKAEQAFLDAGFGTTRRELMYNDFIIIGPEADPAGIKGKSAADAFKAIQAKKAPFASRGDDSGTHKVELKIWGETGLGTPDKEAWYVQTGQGMMKTLAVTEEKDGYTLTDRATYIKYEDNHKGNPELKILCEGDKALFNQYSVIPVNPKHCPNAKHEMAQKFSDWLASPKIQQFIGDYKILGKQLFTPNAK